MSIPDAFARLVSDGRMAPKALAAGIALIVADLVLLGPFSYYKMHDNGEFLVAIVRAVAPRFPDLGLLYANGMAGVDRLAQGAFGGLDALSFRLLPDWLALQLLTVGMIAVCAFFTYRLAMDHFSGAPAMAALAGVAAAWAVGSAELHQYSMALVPGLLWSVEAIRRNGKDRRGYAALVVLTLLYAATAPTQFLVLVHAPVLFLWLTAVFPTAKLRAWLAALFVVVVPVLLRLQDLAAAALFAPQSHRLDWTAETSPGWLEVATHPSYLPELVLVAALLSGVFTRRGQERALLLRLLALAAFIQASLILAPWIKTYVVGWLPVLNGINVGRVAAAATVLWTVALAAVPLPAPAHTRRQATLVLGLVGALAVLVGVQKVYRAEEYLRLGNFVANFESDQLHRLAARIEGDTSFPRVEPIKGTPMLFQGYGLETLGGYFTLFTERYQQFWTLLTAPLAASDPTAYSKMAGWGNRLLLTRNQRDPESSLASYANHDLISLAGVRYIVAKNPLSDPGLVLLEGPKSAWDSLSNIQKVVANLKANFTGFERFYVYENPQALPRFFAPERLDLQPEVDGVLRVMGQRSVHELATAAPALAADWPTIRTEESRPGRVLAVRRTVDAYAVDVNFAGGGFLAASVNYFPWWQATFVGRDGSRQPLTTGPLYHTFLGILVPAGAGTVELKYMPPHRLGSAP